MSERSVSSLRDGMPLVPKRAAALAAAGWSVLLLSGCFLTPKAREESGKVAIYLACPDGTTGKIEDVVEPRRTDSVPASVGFTCVDGEGNPQQPPETGISTNQSPDGTSVMGMDNVAEFSLGYTYREGEAGKILNVTTEPALGQTPFSFVQISGVDRISCHPVAQVPTGAGVAA